MKRKLTYATIFTLALSLCGTQLDARGRNGNDSGNQSRRPASTSQPAPRPSGNNNRPGGNHDSRPGNNNRPGGNHDSRPGNNNRPGGNHDSRPGNNNRPGFSPNNPGGRPNQPAPRPVGNVSRPMPPYYNGAFNRPQMPPHRPYFRPAPPPSSWRPSVSWPRLRTILGISLGSSINLSLDLLLNSGYNINAYGNDCIYLSNVPMLNCYWPYATLYYNNAGGLTSGQFVYSTPSYSMARYNTIYSGLLGTYGTPYSVTDNGATVSATWWGDNQFITLSFTNGTATDGSFRYFTTLSFGN